MTKPTWDDAPDWANYMAMDRIGRWKFFAERPIILHGIWIPDGNSDQRVETWDEFPGWRESLEVRG